MSLMWPVTSLDVEGPASATMVASIHVGEDPSDLPTISRPLSCSSYLTSSSGEGGVLSEGTSGWGPLLQPNLSITFVLAILNGAAGGRMPGTRGGVPGNQRPPESRVCSGWIKG